MKGDLFNIPKTNKIHRLARIKTNCSEMVSINKAALIDTCMFIVTLMAMDTHGYSTGVDQTGSLTAIDKDPKSAHHDFAKRRLRRYTTHNVFNQ